MGSGEDLERTMGSTIFYQKKPRAVYKPKVEIEKPPTSRCTRTGFYAQSSRHIEEGTILLDYA